MKTLILLFVFALSFRIGAAARLNINSAGIAQFDAVSEISFIERVRIIKHREKYGLFHTKEELYEKGLISRQTFEKIKNRITVNDSEPADYNFGRIKFSSENPDIKITEEKKRRIDYEDFKDIVKMIKIENYKYSAECLQRFIKKYNESEYLDDCYFLLGTCHEMQKQYTEAFIAYKTVKDNFISSEIRDIAVLRMAICLDCQKKSDEALLYYRSYCEMAGESDYSVIARARIEQIEKKEGK